MNFSTYAAIFEWQPAAWLRVTGSDSGTFLQGQFTNDLRMLEAGRAVYGLWLNVKGKVVADSFVVGGATKDEFWVGSYFSPADVIRGRLEAFAIADDVTIEDLTASVSAVTIFRGETDAALVPPDAEGWIFPGQRSREDNREWVFPMNRREAIQVRLGGLPAISADEVARRRIKSGIPAIPADLGLGDLPNEGGLEAEAISYTKGCYLGQEVMARLKTMGQVRRRLVRVAFAREKIPPLPTPVFLGARQVGELRSAAPEGPGHFVGLAMVSLLHVGTGAQLAFAGDAPATITVDKFDPR